MAYTRCSVAVVVGAAVALTASIVIFLHAWMPAALVPLLQAPLQATGVWRASGPTTTTQSLAQLEQVEKLHASGRLVTYIGGC
jgi:hypothetical protein